MSKSHAVGHVTFLATAGLLAWSGGVGAQSVNVEPSLNTRLTFTDNANATSTGKKSDWIAEVAPGVAVSRRSGRFNGSLNAQLRGIVHASETGNNAAFLALDGRGVLEAIDKLLFVDMDASISRDNRTGLTGRGTGDFLDIESENETRQLSVGPRLQFSVGQETDVTVGYKSTWFDGGGDINSRRRGQWQTTVSSPQSFGYFGWGLDYRNSSTDGDVRAQSSEVVRGTLFVRVTPQFRLRGIVGHEWNDFDSQSSETGTITGGGFDWNPTERTSISGTVENRVFGRGFDVSFRHRHALWAWDLAYSRDFSSSLDSLSVIDDPLYRVLNALLANQFPDPIERDREIRRFFAQQGIAVRQSNFVTNSQFVSRSLAGSVSLIGVRSALTLSLNRTERERIGGAIVTDPRDDFGSFGTVTTTSGTLALSHRVSAITSLNASMTRSRSEGGGATSVDTRRMLYSLGVSTQLGARTSGSLTYRHQRSDGASDFTENVLTANVGMRF